MAIEQNPITRPTRPSLFVRLPARLGAALGTLIGAAAATHAQPEGDAPPERRVLVIGVDGLKPDAIPEADTPVLDDLIARGTYNDNAQSEDLTFSGPNWSSILHGVHRDRHGVVNNAYMPTRLGDHPDLFAHLEHANPEWTTARLSTWDMIHQRQPTGADIDLFQPYDQGGDDFVAKRGAALIAGDTPDAPHGTHAIFVYLGNVDIAGHTHGFHKSVRGYLDAIEVADAQIGQLIDAVRAREAAHHEAWLVVLTSDHGGNIDKGHAGNTIDRRTVPFLVSGQLAAKGAAVPEPKNVDVVATVLAYLDVEPMRPIDGHPVGLDPHPSRAATWGTNLLINPGGEHDRGFGSGDLDQAIAGWTDPGPGMMSVMPYGTEGGWPTGATPGPDNRGANFFMGGTAPLSEITQQVDLAALSPRIARGRIRFTLSAWLGGFEIQDDHAEVRLDFLSPEGIVIGGHVLGPVTAEDRDFETKLLERSLTGYVPQRAVAARVTLRSVKRSGEASDGYADNLSLMLHPR